jgi:hypothetical protein
MIKLYLQTKNNNNQLNFPKLFVPVSSRTWISNVICHCLFFLFNDLRWEVIVFFIFLCVISCCVHFIMWYFLFCSLCHVVFLVLSILLYGISCFVHYVMWYLLFSSFYHVVFLGLTILLYGISCFVQQEITHNKMNKTRNTI